MRRIATWFLLVAILTTDLSVIASDPTFHSAASVPTNPSGFPLPASILEESTAVRNPLDVGSANLTPPEPESETNLESNLESELNLESETPQELLQSSSFSQSQESRSVNNNFILHPFRFVNIPLKILFQK
jgi:hypothetical protein